VGSSAAVSLTTATVASALVVPTSAVRTVGTRHVVEVLSGSTVSPVAVTTGATGPLRTEVLSGLAVGQQVVLADLSSTVTSDGSTTGGTTGGFRGGAGRFAGGVGAPGGVGAARPGG
jgi:trimeric autotransporter adhesin